LALLVRMASTDRQTVYDFVTTQRAPVIHVASTTCVRWLIVICSRASGLYKPVRSARSYISVQLSVVGLHACTLTCFCWIQVTLLSEGRYISCGLIRISLIFQQQIAASRVRSKFEWGHIGQYTGNYASAKFGAPDVPVRHVDEL